MLKLLLIGAALLAVTVLIHAVGTTFWLRFLLRRYASDDGQWLADVWMRALLGFAVVVVMLHTVEIMVWAVAYRALVPLEELASLEAAVYFSFVTFTTLGYGDVTLGEETRLLSGIEALNGILLVGWTTAMLFAIVQRGWQHENRRNLER